MTFSCFCLVLHGLHDSSKRQALAGTAFWWRDQVYWLSLGEKLFQSFTVCVIQTVCEDPHGSCNVTIRRSHLVLTRSCSLLLWLDCLQFCTMVSCLQFCTIWQLIFASDQFSKLSSTVIDVCVDDRSTLNVCLQPQRTKKAALLRTLWGFSQHPYDCSVRVPNCTGIYIQARALKEMYRTCQKYFVTVAS